jgi:transposase
MMGPEIGGGRARTTDMRDVVEAILFIASGGCQWRMLPQCFPPVSTVRGYLYAWREAGPHLVLLAPACVLRQRA